MLQVAEGARLCGATKIIGVDLNPAKYEMGKHMLLLIFYAFLGDGGANERRKEWLEHDQTHSVFITRVHSLPASLSRFLGWHWIRFMLGVSQP